MAIPITRGIIIAASVVVAAGIAIYENEQVRRWLDEHRRRIAIALYSLGDGINPSETDSRSPQQQAEMAELTRQRRHDIVRQNREDLLRRAREDGTAVDLDELIALGILEREELECAEQQKIQIQSGSHIRSNSNTSFDDFVGNDGKLKNSFAESQRNEATTAIASAVSSGADAGLRQRGAGARGFAMGSAFGSANPFDDEYQIHSDEHFMTPSADEFPAVSVTDDHTIRSVSPRPEETPLLPDVRPVIHNIPIWESEHEQEAQPQQFKTEDELNAEIEEAIRRSLQDEQLVNVDSSAYASSHTLQPSSTGNSIVSTPHSLADSLFGPSSPRTPAALPFLETHQEMTTSSTMPTLIPSTSPFGSYHSAVGEQWGVDGAVFDGEQTPGMMTPTDDAFSTISSVTGDREPLEPTELERALDCAEVASEADTNDSFSVVGVSTPGSWTDVESDSETEAGNGESHVFRT